MNDQSLSFRRARIVDASAIVALANLGYRGEASKQGWTTEAELLGGIRTDEDEVRGLIEMKDSMILLCERDSEIIGTVHLQKVDDAGYLGLFVVKPNLQGAGIGKQFIAAAEQEAKRAWDIAKMTMTVITLRTELIAFYERRGYRRTGKIIPFPAIEGVIIPKVENLQMEYLEKAL